MWLGDHSIIYMPCDVQNDDPKCICIKQMKMCTEKIEGEIMPGNASL